MNSIMDDIDQILLSIQQSYKQHISVQQCHPKRLIFMQYVAYNKVTLLIGLNFS